MNKKINKTARAKNSNRAVAKKNSLEIEEKNGVVSSENTAINVAFFEKDYSSEIVNDDLAKRIGKGFQEKLDELLEGDFNLACPDEAKRFVKAVNDYQLIARGFYDYLHDLTHLCSSLGMTIIVTLNAPCCGIKQIFIFPRKYKIISDYCYRELEGFFFTEETYPIASGESSNLYKISDKVYLALPLDDFADVICDSLAVDEDPIKLAKWIKDFKDKI